MSEDLEIQVLDSLDAASEAVEAEDLDLAERHLAEARAKNHDIAELAFLEGYVAMLRDDMDRMVARLKHALSLDDSYADAHHLLARYYEAEDEGDLRKQHDLKTLAIESAELEDLDEEETEDAQRFIEGHAEHVLAKLPEPFRARLENVPILITPMPSEDAVQTGLDPKTLGLFEGPTDAQKSDQDVPVPSRIVLFWWNLLTEFGDEEDDLVEEIKVTLLHEVGHFFGLDEDEVAQLGLA